MLRLIEIDVYQAQRAYFTGGHLRDIDLSAPLRSAISNAGIVLQGILAPATPRCAATKIPRFSYCFSMVFIRIFSSISLIS